MELMHPMPPSPQDGSVTTSRPTAASPPEIVDVHVKGIAVAATVAAGAEVVGVVVVDEVPISEQLTKFVDCGVVVTLQKRQMLVMHPMPPLAQLESVVMLIPTAASPDDTPWVHFGVVVVP
jgi:hypothetical protein